MFRIIGEETRQPAANPVAEVLRSGAVTGLANHTLLLAKDGREIPIDDSAAPVCDEQGQLHGVVLVFRDITQRRQVEKALRQQATELQRSNEELQQFAYIASHDLQEPLRMVGSYVQLLAKRYRGKLDADADEFIGFAVEGATRMQQLILDLLAYTRAGGREQEFTTVDCETVLRRTLDNLRLAIEESAAAVTAGPLPAVRGDAGQLGLVFQNLIGNALKFRSEAPPRIHVSAERESTHWRFAVRDNGIGIEPGQTQRVFQIF